MRGTGVARHRESLHFQHRAPAGDLLTMARTAAGRLVGPYGVVRHCRSFPEGSGRPTTPICVARGPKRGFGGREPGFEVIGMGVSDDSEDAWLKAVMEAVERYCFAWPHDPSLVERRSYRDVSSTAVPLELFRVFSQSQYESRPSLRFPDDTDPIDWVWAYSLTSERFARVPAAVAYSTVGFRPPNNFGVASSSTGVACHVSVEAALLAGLLEVVERDAIMLHWLHRRSPRRVVVEGPGAAEVTRLMERHFSVDGIEFTLFDITADTGIPTICCRASSTDPDQPASAFGAACRPEPAPAARKALFECAQVLAGLHGLGCDGRSPMDPADVRNIWDHARFYASAANAAPLEAFAGSEQSVALGELSGVGWGSVAEDLRVCVERLAALGLEVLCVDLTPADVAGAGLRTVKVLVPGMVDLNGDARLPQLGPERLRTVPAALGWPPLGADGPNPAPCPMS